VDKGDSELNFSKRLTSLFDRKFETVWHLSFTSTNDNNNFLPFNYHSLRPTFFCKTMTTRRWQSLSISGFYFCDFAISEELVKIYLVDRGIARSSLHRIPFRCYLQRRIDSAHVFIFSSSDALILLAEVNTFSLFV